MTVDVERRGSVAVVTFARPESGNRLDRETLEAFTRELTAFGDPGAEDAPTVVLLRSIGPDFSLGREPSATSPNPNALLEEFGRIQHVNELIQRAPYVTIAAVQGRVFGAGLSLAARCDMVVAARSAIFAFPEVGHGIPPTIVLSHYQYVLPRKALMDMILTGRGVGASEAVGIGLASRIADDGDLDNSAASLAAEIGAADPRTLRTVKRFMRMSEGLDPRDAPGLGIQVYAAEMADRVLSAEEGTVR